MVHTLITPLLSTNPKNTPNIYQYLFYVLYTFLTNQYAPGIIFICLKFLCLSLYQSQDSIFFTSRATGLYTKTLASIIMRDITRFIVVFAVVCISFCGAVFLSLRGASVQHLYRYDSGGTA